MGWCGAENTLTAQDSPSECLCFAIIAPIPSFAIALFLLVRYGCMKNSPPSVHESNRYKRLLVAILCCCCVHVILFVAISFSESITPAKISAVVLEVIAWSLCGFSVYRDYTTDTEWPCMAVNIFFIVEVVVCAIVAATVYSDDRLAASFILGVLLFLVSLCASLLSIFKHTCAPNVLDDDKYFRRSDEEERVSFFGNMGLKLFGSPLGEHDDSGSVSPKKPLLSPTNSVDSDGDKYNGLGFDERDSFGSVGGYGRPSSSRWSVASEEVSLVKSAMEVRLTDVEKSARATSTVGYYSSSPRKGAAANAMHSGDGDSRTVATSKALARVLEQPQSARAAHALSSSSTGLMGALAPGGTIGASRRPTRRRGGTGGGEFSAASRRDRSSGRDVPSVNPCRGERMSSGANPLDALHVLVEKWGLRRPGFGHEEIGRENGSEWVAQFTHQSIDDGDGHHPRRLESFVRLDPEAQKQRDTYLRNVLKEGGNALVSMSEEGESEEDEQSTEEGRLSMPARQSSPGLEDGGALHHGSARGGLRPVTSSSSLTGSGVVSVPTTDLSSRISLVDPSTQSLLMELEFEISLSLLDDADDLFTSHGGGWGARSGRRGDGDGDGSKDGQWAVWRTGKELLSLHAVLVGLFGDLAPRRPKLRTCRLETAPTTTALSGGTHSHTPEKDKTSVSREAILNDMRLIAGYLRALISQPIFHCPAFHTFLDITQHVDINLEVGGDVAASVTGLPRDGGSASVHMESHIVDGGNDHGPGGSMATGIGGGTSTVQDSFGPPPEGSVSVSVANRGAMDAAAEDSGIDQKDRWRKVFLNLRKNLKPRELAVRCRVFEGVITGEDISRWMVTSVYGYAHDATEAALIAQGLLSAGLLCPMCVGYSEKPDEDPTREQMYTFSSSRGYVYRYHQRPTTFSLFGAGVTVSIPQWIQVDADGNVSSGREKEADGQGQGAGYIQYVVRVKLVDDTWTVSRRYNEFSALHKMLQRDRVKPVEAFPSTSFGQLMMGQVTSVSTNDGSKREQRREDLDVYLRSAVEAALLAAMEMPEDAADVDRTMARRHRLLTMLAEFLDNDHRRLRIVPSDEVMKVHSQPEAAAGEDEEATIKELQSISDAVGL